MSFNLEFFKANLNFGVAKPNTYEIIISAPGALFAPEIDLMAEEAEIPGKSLASREMGLYGPQINFPYREIYTNLRISFICSSDLWERKWFETWQRSIVNPKSGYFGYYKDYVRDIRIRQLNSYGNLVYEGVAIECWPTTIFGLPLSYKSQNEYHKLTVSFSYVRFMDEAVLTSTSGDSGVSTGQMPSRVGPVNENLPPAPNPIPQ